jgi:hypothetical protein
MPGSQAMQMLEVSSPTLADQERVIESGMEAFVSVGLALLDIRDRHLYREVGYTRFDVYCRERWGFAGRRAYQLIEAAGVAQAILSFNGNGNGKAGVCEPLVHTPQPMPQSERVARELAPLLKQEGVSAVVDVFQDLIEQYGADRVTAEVVRESVATRLHRAERRASVPLHVYKSEAEYRPATLSDLAADAKQQARAGLIIMWAAKAVELLYLLANYVPDDIMRERVAYILRSFPQRPILYDPDEQVLISPDFKQCTALTAAESVIIARLMEVPGWLVNLGQLLEALSWTWGWGTNESVRKMIVDLRRKLLMLGWSEAIFENERDLGWRINKGELADAWTIYTQSFTTPSSA